MAAKKRKGTSRQRKENLSRVTHRTFSMPFFFADWYGLRLRYASTDTGALVLLLFSACVATLGFNALLSWLGGNYQATLPPGLYQRLPKLTWASFLMPSAVLGMLT